MLTVRPRPGEDSLRLAERALVAGHCGAILVWLERLERFAVSRLQQAARGSDTAVFLFCPPGAMAQPLAGELRVYVSTHSRRLAVEILACRGGAGSVLQLAGEELADAGQLAPVSRPARGLPRTSRHPQKFTAHPELVGN